MTDKATEKKTLSLLKLKSESEKDTKIDKNKLDQFALELSSVLAKWAQYLLDEKMEYETKFIQYSIIKKQKYEHYRYDYKYIIETRGGEMDIYLNSDIELLKAKDKMMISKQKILFIENVMKTLTGAGFNVKNIIEWNKFMAGGY